MKEPLLKKLMMKKLRKLKSSRPFIRNNRKPKKRKKIKPTRRMRVMMRRRKIT